MFTSLNQIIMKKIQLYFIALLILVFQLPVICARAQNEPVVAYVTITAAKSGQIKGSSTNNENKGKIECIGFSYSVKSPRDASSGSGMATGKTIFGNIVIVKYFDNATPLLMQAALSNEALISVIIEFYKKGMDGKLILSQTIKLSNAFISQISQYAGTTAPEKAIPNSLPAEEISFTAGKIEFDSSGNITPGGTGGTVSKFNVIENKKQ
jgi:type VI secretion system Hcp family effector